ncbi:TetR/AcrR family transcriptional regulator [Geobacter grbiciae]|uniref:TetR/AcrR family transcriptional regulator n=1 Tax=Geobacter grbiciae TaxID=155042 RepID=UPI001C00F787|nr:TetR/AcrR family transcriptional regulator [Geobacter grbiciae]MBT1074015.1 TetR/AcrR family transcriptional regulator [Geobacter grbiciae]
MTKSATKHHGGIKREQILDAALGIIAQNGVKTLTPTAIAGEIGITEATLHRHFTNEDEILSETVGRIGAELMKNLDYIYDSDPSVVVSLKRFFILHLDYIKANMGIVRLVFSGGIFMAGEGLREKVSEVVDTYSTELEALIQHGKKTGAIGHVVDPAAAASMLIGMVLAMTLKWSLNGYSFSLVNEGMKLWRNYEEYLTSGILRTQPS